MEHTFELIPFPDISIPEIKITGRIAREQAILTINYSIKGRTDLVLFPEASAQPGRKHELWQTTCFEFFLAIPRRSPYWEFNLSPSGNWNVFRMDAYRQIELREEELVRPNQLEFRKKKECFDLEAVFNLDPILGSNMEIQAGIASVIQSCDGHLTYWSLTHPSHLADFHLRESFIIQI